jgi:hypothetical protein
MAVHACPLLGGRVTCLVNSANDPVVNVHLSQAHSPALHAFEQQPYVAHLNVLQYLIMEVTFYFISLIRPPPHPPMPCSWSSVTLRTRARRRALSAPPRTSTRCMLCYVGGRVWLRLDTFWNTQSAGICLGFDWAARFSFSLVITRLLFSALAL